jgi:lysophospholipase L1-like esterase
MYGTVKSALSLADWIAPMPRPTRTPMPLPVPARRGPHPGVIVAAAVGGAHALGGAIWGLFAFQIHRAKTAPRPYVEALPADGLIGDTGDTPVRVVWVGDSLAAGLGVDVVDDTPAHLVARMLDRPVDLTVLAVPGHTSADVTEHQLPALLERTADVIVLCVGANDVAQMKKRSRYSERLDAILTALAPTPTLVLSTPDMGMPDRLAQPLRGLAARRGRWFERARAKVVARHAHAHSVDVATRPAELSRKAGRAMLCADKFHPGPEAYRIWAERIAERCQVVLAEAGEKLGEKLGDAIDALPAVTDPAPSTS